MGHWSDTAKQLTGKDIDRSINAAAAKKGKAKVIEAAAAKTNEVIALAGQAGSSNAPLPEVPLDQVLQEAAEADARLMEAEEEMEDEETAEGEEPQPQVDPTPIEETDLTMQDEPEDDIVIVEGAKQEWIDTMNYIKKKYAGQKRIQ